MIGLDARLVMVNLGIRLIITDKDVNVKKPYSASRYTVFLRLYYIVIDSYSLFLIIISTKKASNSIDNAKEILTFWLKYLNI